MPSPAAVTLVFAGLGMALAGACMFLLWQRQWRWGGLVTAIGCLAGAAIHLTIPFAMLALPEYPSSPTQTTPIVWHYGPGYFLLACALVAIFAAGMVAALTAPKRWSAPVLFIASGWMLVTAVASLVAQWIKTGNLPILSVNGDVPVWIGFPVLLGFIVAPFAYAILWSVQRHPQRGDAAAANVLSQQWMVVGIAGLVLLMIVAAFILGASQSDAALAPRAARIEHAFMFAVICIAAVTLSLVVALQRLFLKPAAEIIDRIRTNASLAAVVPETSVWAPMVAAVQAARDQLDQSRAQLEALYEHVPVPLTVIRTNGEIILANKVCAEYYGLSLPEFTTAKMDDLAAHWPEIDQVWTVGLSAAAGGTAQQIVTRFRRAGEEKDRLIELTIFPIRDPKGGHTHVGTIAIDITAQRETEARLAAQKEHLHQSEKLAALGQLLAGVAHELNNPLTVLVGRTAILAEKLKGTAHEKAIADLREAADRSNRIVRTFLAMARQEAPRRRQVQINDALEAAFDLVVYGLRSAGITIEWALDPALGEVSADEDQLVQIFTNLFINAQHALEDHEGPRNLQITTRMDGDAVVAEIADSGPGVPPALASRIFEPFFTTKDVGQGTGMGLAMARGMIEEHGGTLSHHPAPLGGALFAVRLSLSRAGSEDPVPESEADGALQPPAARALVVDDEAAIRSLLIEVLEADGIACAEAGDGGAALELLAKHPFDLVFSDIRMPGIDGIRLRERIASDHPHLLDRLVFMSGDVMHREGARYATLAGHLIIDKPFNPEDIRHHVADLLGGQGDRP